MAGRILSNWWGKVSPYYAKTNKQIWVGVGIMTYLFYRLSHGGKKAVKDKPAH
ncbi:hypothetical protein PAMP_013935 [Pampus punctatissimus]